MKSQEIIVGNLYKPSVSSVLSAASDPLRHTSLGGVGRGKSRFCSFDLLPPWNIRQCARCRDQRITVWLGAQRMRRVE